MPRASKKITGDASDRYRVQVLERAFDILDALAAHEPQRSLNELCEDVDLHKSTTHRLLQSLEARAHAMLGSG